jgi:YVTN family beta-propeller protein
LAHGRLAKQCLTWGDSGCIPAGEGRSVLVPRLFTLYYSEEESSTRGHDRYCVSKLTMRRFFYLCCFFVCLGVFSTTTGYAQIEVNLESPAADQGVSGIGAVAGWAFSSVPGEQVTVQLSIDGVTSTTIPCCSDRNDVALRFPGNSQARRSGFALLFNFNLLSEGAHMIKITVQDSKGNEQTQTHAITVAKPGGFEFLSDFTLSGSKASLSDDKQEVIVEGAEVQDKATEKTQKVNIQLAWQENAQRIGIVQATNVGNPSGGNNGGGSGGSSCTDTNSCVLPTGIQLTVENPSGGSTGATTETLGGISVVSGWTFSPTEGAEINSIRLRVDSGLITDIPCCSERQDVKAGFAGQPDWLLNQAEQSGFGTLLNFSLLSTGVHTLTVEVQDSTGATNKADRSVEIVKLADAEFLDQFDLSEATPSVEGETLVLENVTVHDKTKASGQTEKITATYVWQPDCQCFIPQKGCGNGSIESGEECDVDALDGETCTSLGFSGGTLSCRPRCGPDDKNCVLPCVFALQNCTGNQFIYVANTTGNSVSVVNPATDTDQNPIVATIKHDIGGQPRGIAASPDGSRVYVSNFQNNTLSMIDTATNTVTDTIPVGTGPVGVAVALDGTKVYVVNSGNDSVSVVNTATNTVQTTISVGREPLEIALTPDGKQAYVTNHNENDNSVSVLNLGTNTVLTTVLVGKGPNGVAVSPDNTMVYVVNYGTDNENGNSVTALDRASNTVTGTVQVGLQPAKVAFSPDSTKAYVSNSVSNSISVIDTASLTIVDTITVGGGGPAEQPDGLVVGTGGARLYVAIFGRGFGSELLEISTTTNTVLESIRVGNGPFAVATVPVAKPSS